MLSWFLKEPSTKYHRQAGRQALTLLLYCGLILFVAQPSGDGHAHPCCFPSSLPPTSGSTAIFWGVFYVVV